MRVEGMLLGGKVVRRAGCLLQGHLPSSQARGGRKRAVPAAPHRTVLGAVD